MHFNVSKKLSMLYILGQQKYVTWGLLFVTVKCKYFEMSIRANIYLSICNI